MVDEKGQVGSPSPTQPGLPKNRRRTRMKSLLAQQAAAKAFAQATLPPAPKRQYTKRAARWTPSLSPTLDLRPKHVVVNLQLRHSFNGKFYGPGRVTVTPAKAAVFLNTEHEASQKEMSLVRQEAFVIGIGPSGAPVKRQVPWAKFDQILGSGDFPIQSTEG